MRHSRGMATSYVVLRSSTVAVVVTDDDAVPRIVHWGAPLLHPDADDLEALLDVAIPQGSLDVAVPMGLLPESARGWSAYGGISVHRGDGTGWAPVLTRTASTHAGQTFSWTGTDERAGLTARRA